MTAVDSGTIIRLDGFYPFLFFFSKNHLRLLILGKTSSLGLNQLMHLLYLIKTQELFAALPGNRAITTCA